MAEQDQTPGRNSIGSRNAPSETTGDELRDTADGDPPAVALHEVSKTFAGGQRVLNSVSFGIRRGEIHGLVGENGCGKSTLIKIISGYHIPDEGSELRFDGEPVQFPISAAARGFVRVLHQDLGLIDSLSVTENLRIESYLRGGIRKLNRARERRATDTILRELGLDIDPDTLVGSLPDELRASVAIARTISSRDGGGGLVIFDEPTAHLSRPAGRRLFDTMRRIAKSGSAVLFVSHYLNEILEWTDRVTVMRDGRIVHTLNTAGVDEDRLIRMIVGKDLGAVYPSPAEAGDSVRLAVHGLSGATVSDITFHARAGEILGLTGLLGTGFADVPYLLAGAARATRGRIELDGVPLGEGGNAIRDRIDRGIALVPANRSVAGVATSMTVRENVSLPLISRYFRKGALSRRSERAATDHLISRFDVRPRDPERIVNTLSGGNQQKVVLAKWLSVSPRVLILHEPAQGVDVGARQQIFKEIGQAAAAGAAVVLATVEYEVLAEICDRALVFGHGRVASELRGADLSKERLAEQCFNAVRTAEGARHGPH